MKISKESFKIERSAGHKFRVDSHSEEQIVDSSFTIKSQTQKFEQTKWSFETSRNIFTKRNFGLGNWALLLISILLKIL